MKKQPSESLLLATYGLLMRKLQFVEFSLWQMRAATLKPGTTADQAFTKVSQWDGTTLGAMLRGLRSQAHWDPSLDEDIDWLLKLRNKMAHHFLREFFVVEQSAQNYRSAIDALSESISRVEEIDAKLEAHAASLFEGGLEDLDQKTMGEIDALRPKTWPL